MTVQHRTLTPAEVEAQLAGSTRLAPGLWIDRAGGLHVSVPELLAHFGWPDTPATRDEVTAIVQHVLQEMHPAADVIRQDPES